MDRKLFTDLRLSRQKRLFGKRIMEKLKSLKLAIIGCGRNGSFFSILAPYVGFFHITLIDPDIVEPHNLNASILYGYKDIGKRKVEVVKERIDGVDSSIECVIFPCKVQDREVLPVLESSDVIVSAVDSIPAKNFLNSFVARKIKEGDETALLDLGSGSFVQNGRILLLGSQASLFFPGGACLRCQFLDEDEFTNLSNVSFIIPNGLSAILGMELLFSFLTDYDGDSYNFVLYDCLSHQLVKMSHKSREDCDFCGQEGEGK